jgi:proteic killer suppression protein
MKLGTCRHRGLEAFIVERSIRGIDAAYSKRLSRALSAILDSETVQDLAAFPGWHFHELKGDRAGTYSMRITGNLRLTFTVAGDTANDLNLEDYH